MNTQFPAGVLWDLDGTLVDTEPLWRSVQSQLLDEFGAPALNAEEETFLVGCSLWTAAEFFRERGIPLPPAEFVTTVAHKVASRIPAEATWRPGARELLVELASAGIPSAIVTNSTQCIVDAVLETCPAAWFAATVTSEEVAHGKPDAEPYRLGAARLQLDANDCLAIEDSINGLGSALAAGCTTIGVPHEIPLPEDGSIILVPTLAGLTLERIRELATDHRSNNAPEVRA